MHEDRARHSASRRPIGRGALVAAVAALGMTTVRSAVAATTYECIPGAVGVFGLDGPPDWSPAGIAAHPIGKQLDDPRWNGSTRDDLPQFGGGAMPEGAFRAVQDGAKLYLSLQAIVDPNGTTVGYDAVYIGFGSTTANTAKLVQITLNADNASDTTDFTSTAWHHSGAGWATSPFPAWAQNIAVWTGTGTAPVAAAWAVNVMIDLATLHGDPDVGGALTDKARLFYAIDVNTHVAPPPPLSTTLVWPPGAAFAISAGVPAASMDPTLWGQSILGITDPLCPSGVSLIPEHIGTAPVSDAGIPSTTVVFGGDAATTNTFVAEMDNPPAANSVNANFRLADWGSTIGDSTADWKTILPAGATTPVNSNAANPKEIAWTCHDTTGATDSCPTLPNPTAPTDQCMLVELASVGGITPIHFVQDSARRNLDFIHASAFNRNARLSINGLAPVSGGGPERDVYVYIKTTNMPAEVPPGQLPPQGEDAGPTAPPILARQAREKGPAVYQKSVYEGLRDSWPTYEVHVYHDTGRKVDTGHGPTRILEPQVPFGFLVSHAGTLAGWRHRLEGRGVVLDEISPNFYHLRVPNGGAVTVNTSIEAVETPPPPPPPPPPRSHCACAVVGASTYSPLAWGLPASGFAIAWVRSRRRRRTRRKD